jgi:hypothetical protein
MNWLQKIAEPTGDCFKQALWWAADNGAELVHGKVTNIYGQRFAHAWAEQGNQVVDVTTLGPDQPMDKEKWYKIVEAEVDARYPDAHEAMALGVRAGHWGPWNE